MKHLVKITLSLFLLFSVTTASAKNEDPIIKKKTVNKDLSFSSQGIVSLQNEFGNININTWDQEKLVLEILVEVSESNEKSAQKSLDGITFSFIESYDKFTAISNFKKTSGVHKDARRSVVINHNRDGSTETIIDGKKTRSTIDVKYTLHVPKGIMLKVKNTFGNVFIENSTNTIEAILSYGNLTTGDLTHVKEIDLQFGNIDVKSAKTIDRLDLQYSKGKLGNIHSARLNNHFSDISINKANEITGDCQYGSIIVNEVNDIDIDAQFSDVKILKVNTSVRIDAQYVKNGSLLGVSNNFTEIDLDLQFSTFKIEFAEGASYTAELDGSFSKFNFSNITVIEKDTDMSDDYYLLKKGDGKSKLKVDAQYSKLKF